MTDRHADLAATWLRHARNPGRPGRRSHSPAARVAVADVARALAHGRRPSRRCATTCDER